VTEDVVMPKLGLTMTEGKVVEWLVEDGATVRRGDPLLVVETEKTNVEVEAEADGRLVRVVGAGETVAIETVVGRIESDSGSEPGA
jgi:pyruvate dehydrogenase E2 component (dihydrolipoamide acetyltransferase)